MGREKAIPRLNIPRLSPGWKGLSRAGRNERRRETQSRPALARVALVKRWVQAGGRIVREPSGSLIEEAPLRELLFKVEDKVCDECALALRRFIGHMEGIESVAVEDRKIVVVFDDEKVTDEELLRLTTDSLEKLGHKLMEHWHFI